MTREQLRAAYLAEVGYDPFEDDPSLTDAEVQDLLDEVRLEAAATVDYDDDIY